MCLWGAAWITTNRNQSPARCCSTNRSLAKVRKDWTGFSAYLRKAHRKNPVTSHRKKKKKKERLESDHHSKLAGAQKGMTHGVGNECRDSLQRKPYGMVFLGLLQFLAFCPAEKSPWGYLMATPSSLPEGFFSGGRHMPEIDLRTDRRPPCTCTRRPKMGVGQN